MRLTVVVLLVLLLSCGCGKPVEHKVQVELFFVKVPAQEIEFVAVTRTVSAEVSMAKAVLDELLKGPTAAERQQGLSTLINDGVIVRSVTTDAMGVIHADFSERLQEGVGGSMRVLGIRRQIETTLLKIPGATSIILSVEGQTDGILQP
ncbi:MAG: GerMN domain-containing protein [Candidatus Cryosericum sp.]